MADDAARADIIRSKALAVPHAFLDGAQSDARTFGLVSSAEPVFVKQVHSARVVEVEAPFEGRMPEADGLVTATPGLPLAIVTADCAPVLFADPVAGVIGAAHAGWRGAHTGVLEATVEGMVALGARPEAIQAVIGPCVMQASYEVDAAFREHFGPHDDRHFTEGRPGHWQFDLPGYVESRLRAGGVDAVEFVNHDTYAGESRFYSYRRATHRSEPTEGRQISLIALP